MSSPWGDRRLERPDDGHIVVGKDVSGNLLPLEQGLQVRPEPVHHHRVPLRGRVDAVALVANVVVFALVGLSLQLERVLHEPLLIAATLAAVFLSRGLIAYLVTLLDPKIPRSWSWHHAISLAGLRGGLPIALALGLPEAFPQRAQVLDAVFSVVFVTLVVQGWLLGPLARRLNFGLARRAA